MDEEQRTVLLFAAATLGLFWVARHGAPEVLLGLYLAGIAGGVAAVALAWAGRAMTPPHRMSNALFVPLGLLLPLAETALVFARPGLFWLVPAGLGLLHIHGRFSSEGRRSGKRKARERKLIEANIALRKNPKDIEACLRKARLYEEAKSWPFALESYRKALDMDLEDYPEARFTADEVRILKAMMKERALKEHERRQAASGFVLPERGELMAPGVLLALALWDIRRYLVLASLWMFALWCLRAEPEDG